MTGGPGSGKSFTTMEIFGIDKKLKSSFSSFGLKSVNSDKTFEDFGLKKWNKSKRFKKLKKKTPNFGIKLQELQVVSEIECKTTNFSTKEVLCR